MPTYGSSDHSPVFVLLNSVLTPGIGGEEEEEEEEEVEEEEEDGGAADAAQAHYHYKHIHRSCSQPVVNYARSTSSVTTVQLLYTGLNSG
ncbi:hypothetical protein SprV_0200679000 [Sparganum proliferum]